MSAATTSFTNEKHPDLFRMGRKDLKALAVGRTARATAAKAELARRDANAIVTGKRKPKAAAPAKAPAKPKARVKRENVKPAAGGGGQVARSRAAKA